MVVVSFKSYPCPFRKICPYGKQCNLKGFEVLACSYYHRFREELWKRLEKRLKEVMRDGVGGLG